MKKGISPLIAVVLLIAATVTVAAILANWARSYVGGEVTEFRSKVEKFECLYGAISLISDEYPKIVNDRIVAMIEVAGVPLGNFTFEVIYNDPTTGIEEVKVLKDIKNLALSPGIKGIGIIISENLTENNINPENIIKVRIGSNCSEVKTEWLEIKKIE
ncbi:MAG TPA: hypothetical protein EYH56_02310 [Nanoarchaeota archaeon]|nr:hypothetical protein [Nanoarchaeota archaeon]